MNYIRTPYKRYFWLGIVSLLFFMIAAYFNTIKPNMQSYANRLQSKLLFHENELEKQISNIISTIDAQESQEISFNKLTDDVIYPIFIYESDVLVFWTTNTLPITQSIHGLTHNQMLFLQNGWYYCMLDTITDYRVVGCIPIYSQFPYQNSYLQNGFSELFERNNKFFSIHSNTQSDGFPIVNQNQEYLFSLQEIQTAKNDVIPFWLLFVLFVVGFISIATAIQRFAARHLRYEWLSYVILFVTLFLFRYIQIKFFFPTCIYEHPFFSPFYFAWTQWFGSIGDYLLHIGCVFWVVILLYSRYKKSTKILPLNQHYIFIPLLIFVQIFLLLGAMFLIRILVINSSLTLSFNEVMKMNFIDMTGFFIILLITMSVLLSNYLIIRYYRLLLKNEKLKYYFWSFIVCIFALSIIVFFHYYFYIILYFLGILVLIFLKSERFRISGAYGIISVTTFVILFGALLQKYNTIKEQNYRNLYAIQLSREQDPIGEYLFQDIGKQLHEDSTLKALLEDKHNEQAIEKYLRKNYFSGYLTTYHFQLTVCEPKQFLLIMPSQIEMLCSVYFNELIMQYGRITQTEDLYLINEGTGRPSYLYTTSFVSGGDSMPDTTLLYIELISNPKIAGLGYPELLVDEKMQNKLFQYEYSYAKYFKQKLMMQYGNYIYPHLLKEEYISQMNTFFHLNNFSHLLFRSGNDNIIIVSLPQKTVFEMIANYSYLFIIYVVFLYLFVLTISIVEGSIIRLDSLSSRLQAASVFIVILCFVSAGVIAVKFFIRYHDNKNKEILREKAYSLIIEFEHKISSFQNIYDIDPDYLAELCVKFSNVFFTEMNLFSTHGHLIASSRPQVYQQGLISQLMNQEALQRLKNDNEIFFIRHESIGNLKYMSAYLPFKNIQNDVIAYLNLPFFSRENELKNEISGFLVTFINFYVFLVALAVILALIIAKYITLPLQIISNKLKVLKPGLQNEKINWEKDDEVGQLVQEYNRMIDELDYSTQQLMKAERELAWKEMAKQIAHEIKNPLTPMKLSLQNLIKAWEDKAPDYESRLKRTSETLIEQIDALANIASQFANFALIHESKQQVINIIPILKDTIHLYSAENTLFYLNITENVDIKTHANETLLIQIFNNLIKNAVQSIPNNATGYINIKTDVSDDIIRIEIQDNGIGISEENKLNIFSPNFTSKTGGTGLGLAITKNLIESIGGTISFQSTCGKGSTFIVKLPNA